MIENIEDLKPQDETSVQQIKDIRSVTGVGVMQAKRIAAHLNIYGYITWEIIHRSDFGIIR